MAFLLLGFSSAGQNNLNLSWKRPVNPQDFLYLEYEPGLFQALDFYLERPLQKEHFSVGIEVIYARYHRYMDDLSKNLGDKDDFYDKSFSVGAIGRAYTKPRVWRLYAELGLHGNFLHTYQPISINYYYGVYQRIIDHKQFALSGTLAFGFSLGNERFRWEPYVQIGVIEDIEQKKADRFVTGSLGQVKENTGFLITPLVIKVRLF